MSKVDRANQYANMIIRDKLSIREVARSVGVSKTTVHNYIHKYVTGRLRKRRLAIQLKRNSDAWFLKGASATKQKFKKMKEART